MTVIVQLHVDYVAKYIFAKKVKSMKKQKFIPYLMKRVLSGLVLLLIVVTIAFLWGVIMCEIATPIHIFC